MGDAVPQQLVCWSQGREVWVRDLTESMLCSCSKHFTLTVPLSTQLEYTWVPGGEGRLRGVEHLTNVLEVTKHFVRKSSGKPDETLGVPLRWTGTPSMGVW